MSDILKVENDTSRSDELQRDNFNTWMDQMAKTAYLADTLSDFIRDHNEGNMNIQPSLRSASILARHTLKELVAFTQVTPPPVYGAIVTRSVTKSIEKLRQPNFIKEQFGINSIRGHSNTP